jgi:hypothetical protein
MGQLIAESFFKTLKTELVYDEFYATKEQAKLSVKEAFCNR